MFFYVASSWRNPHQPGVVDTIRYLGHAVYDFRNPAPGNSGFAWSNIDPKWESWDAVQWKEALRHPLAVKGFRADMTALERCDACVLVLPCGRSAHLEAGWAVGRNKPTAVLALATNEPDLMVRMCNELLTNLYELRDWIGKMESGDASARAGGFSR